MKVRDKTAPGGTYFGAVTEASHSDCPCRDCYRIHDCGHNEQVYRKGKWVANKWKSRFECITLFNRGCPLLEHKPNHSYAPTGNVCKRCGHRKPSQKSELT